MNFSDLEANIDDLRSGNADILSEEVISDSDFLQLHRTAALSELKIDLENALSIDIYDTTTLNDVATNFKNRLQKALAYLQLKYFYQENHNGEGSKSDIRFKMYAKNYEKLRSQFFQLKSNITNTIQSVKIWR